MGSGKTLFFTFLATLILTLSTATYAALYFVPAAPPISTSLATSVSRISDFMGISLGLRKITADIAWIQTLIYYGTHEEHTDSDHEGHSEVGKYPLFLAYCQRVARIDPNFKYIFYYGSSVLGWNLERVNEAEEFLKEGIRTHPEEWRYKQFLAGIAYQKDKDINSLVSFLEVFIEDKNCPNILRSILASIYKKQKDYRKALRVWIMIYDTKDPGYQQRAAAEIDNLAQMAHMGSKNRP